MSTAFIPAWGQPQLFAHDHPAPLPVTAADTGSLLLLTFGRELVCELRPPAATRQWVFSLVLPVGLPPLPAPPTVALRLRLFVYKPAGLPATVQLKCAGQAQALAFRPDAAAEGDQLVSLTAPLRLVQDNLVVHFQVNAGPAAGVEPLVLTLNELAVQLG